MLTTRKGPELRKAEARQALNAALVEEAKALAAYKKAVAWREQLAAEFAEEFGLGGAK